MIPRDHVDVDVPEIRYAWNGDNALAYQVFGEGAIDLVYLPQYFQNLEWNWTHPLFARYLRRMASFCRVIVMDQRGHGCSDHADPLHPPSLETHVDDVLAVMDAAGSTRAALHGAQDTGFIVMLAAATHPDRVSALILYGTTASFIATEELPWEWPRERWGEDIRWMREWGTPRHAARYLGYAAPSLPHDEESLRWAATAERLTMGPGGAVVELGYLAEWNLTHVLPSIRVPTLVLHRTEDPSQPIQSGRYLADHIPGARFVELPGEDTLEWIGESDVVLDEIEEFLTGMRRGATHGDRALATVLFTDIVGSTEKAAELGDSGWKDLIERHHRTVRTMIDAYRGREIDTAGDGFFATFDGPARAVRCAQAVIAGVHSMGLEVRAGLHTGEIETIDGKVGGIAVMIGARICGMAAPSEVLASSTVKDLVAGSGLRFEDRGEHKLKGLLDAWHLFAW